MGYIVLPIGDLSVLCENLTTKTCWRAAKDACRHGNPCPRNSGGGTGERWPTWPLPLGVFIEQGAVLATELNIRDAHKLGFLQGRSREAEKQVN